MDQENVVKIRDCNALVVEGGAMRGIFSTGVLDAFLENQFHPFDICIGVSAGATNIASYLAEMYQRNYTVYTDYSVRPDFINWMKFIKGGHLVDLDWLWDITIKEIRLDLEKIFSSEKQYFIGVTEAKTGRVVYLQPNKSNLEEMLKASSSIPMFYRKMIRMNGMDVVDGGLADPIPVMEAYRRGARNIMVLRSRPHDYMMKPSFNHILSKWYFKQYPQLLNAIENRSKVYQQSIEFMRNPPKGIKIFEVNPPKEFRTNRLTKDVSILNQDYQRGYKIGIDMIEKWNKVTK